MPWGRRLTLPLKIVRYIAKVFRQPFGLIAKSSHARIIGVAIAIGVCQFTDNINCMYQEVIPDSIILGIPGPIPLIV